ncbi:MAG: peptidoglycan-binding domain-containing protein [Salaquimonas sp.]
MKKKIFASFIASLSMSGIAIGQELPPADAKAGECYAKVLIPAVYQTSPSQVVVQPESKSMKKTEAVYREITKEVLIEEESYVLEPVPPVYETVTEQILVEPEQIIKTIIPATFRNESKQVMVSPARVEWKQGRGAFEKLDSATGEIMCRVEIPAVFETVTSQIIDQPATTTDETIPAKYITVEKRVMKTPPTTQKKIIPAKYKTVTIKELVTPASFQVEVVPAQFATIEKKQLVAKESIEWRQILCETNTTPDLVLRLQQALVSEGYSLGTAPNGNYGPATKAAIQKYQKDKGLPTGGLTLTTVQSLGLMTNS